ncbi:carbohydrate kinase [Lusitaniella coriacea LEGE 07157]|uniref:Carbohydrate kinase n=1 Tax=Lusitaniella coriacea LEGE 07157 TaxID=945747 RepID=A0A8J7E610_9CYAN|nr:carbohydrate kinase [Lusitaniella coriacea LEGE 07157]
MTDPRVLCLGEILFDCLADQMGQPLEAVESWTPYPGGAPANVACALVKLGTPAAFIGSVGQDKEGQELCALLQSIGVDTTGIQHHPTAPTRQVYVLRSESGDREFAGFGDRAPDSFADADLQAGELPIELFQKADFLVLGTLELAYEPSRAATLRALSLAEQYGVKVVLDVNWRPMFWRDTQEAKPLIEELWSAVDFLKLSNEEAQMFFGTEDAGAIAHRIGSVEGVLVTAGGEKPISYCLSDTEGKVPPVAVAVQDTTGAGDAFLAGFLHQLCQQGIAKLGQRSTAKQIVTYASAVGGLTTMKPGAIAAQPSAAQVEAFISQQ